MILKGWFLHLIQDLSHDSLYYQLYVSLYISREKFMCDQGNNL